jgi:beta-lactamase class A
MKTLLAILLIMMTWGTVASQGVSSPTAEALARANLRAEASLDAAQVGEIVSGIAYPLVGQSEFVPWLLIGDPITRQPIGWVYRDLVTVTGDLAAVPLSDSVVQVIGGTSPSAPPPQATPGGAEADSTTPAPATIVANVTAMTQGEVNVRFGPGVDYPRIGTIPANASVAITGWHTQFPWIQVAFDPLTAERGWVLREIVTIQGDLFSTPAISTEVFTIPAELVTPAPLDSRPAPFTSSVPLGDGLRAIGQSIWDLMIAQDFDPLTSRFGALFILDLRTGESVAFNHTIAFSGTSINKVPILMRVYAALDAPPTATLATDIANTMICSENGATNRLLEFIGDGDPYTGTQRVTGFLRDLGLENTFITAPYTIPGQTLDPARLIAMPETPADQTKANVDFSNQMTVDEVGWLLQALYTCAYDEDGPLITEFDGQFEPRECRQMLHVMANNTVDALIKTGTPEGTRVAHKHGWIEDTHGNAALVFSPGGDYIMVMMMHQPEWLNYQESLPVIAESSRLVYNYFNPEAPLDIIRDGFIPEANTCNFAGSDLVLDIRQPIWEE